MTTEHKTIHVETKVEILMKSEENFVNHNALKFILIYTLLKKTRLDLK